MSDVVTVKIEGLDELQKKLEDLPQDLAKRGIRQSLKAGAQVIQEAMVAGAPEDTGFMSQHFGTRTKMYKNDLAGSAFVGPEGKIDYPNTGGGYRTKENDKGKKYNVGRISVARVAGFLEFGTSRMAKRPFMTQAFEAQKDSALNAMIVKLKEWLTKVSR